MKKVFSKAHDVIHLFAQQSQEDARCANVFMEKDYRFEKPFANKIYSYGHHYLLAEFIYNPQGREAIMINDRGYSATTSKHIALVTGATKQYKQFFETQTNPDRVLSQLQDLSNKLVKARKPEKYISEAQHLFDQYSNYCSWALIMLDARITGIMPVFAPGEALERLRDYVKKEEKRKRKESAKRLSENLAKFNNYEISSFTADEDYVRISQDGQGVETSQLIKVPIREAKVLYQMILSGKDIHGFKIGYYTVIGLNGTLKIGCHHINVQNMHEIGKQLLL